ncbi:MAG: T9SS type A sorting domain-containing protein, partial [Paludibacter sp.]|nr:T9SS type A sorting domain-containing protein [Paludibacter sp.]
PATSLTTTMVVNAVVPASVTIAPSANNVCAGTSVTFTPTPVGGGTTPTYQWYKNTVAVATTATYTYTPANGDAVYVVMTSNAPCASGSPATSPTTTMVVNAVVPASVTIAPSANNVCAGTSVTFTPTPVGGGTTPTYQWYKNTVAVATTATYTYTPANGDAVYVVMTSNAPCASGSPATSPTTTMVVNAVVPASVTIAPSGNNVPAGTSVTFTPTPTGGGTAPAYQWYVNAIAVATSPIYTYIPLSGDVVYTMMTSNAPCDSGTPVQSNSIIMSLVTGIGELADAKILIYSQDKDIFVNCSENAKQICIYNTLGSLVRIENNVSGLKRFYMNNIANAYYFVKIVTDRKVYTQKVLIK